MLSQDEEQKLFESRRDWRGLCILLMGFLALVIMCKVVNDASAPRWGYTGWERGPRILFKEEVECWRHLANAKKTNEYLLTQDCTPEKE